MTALRTLLKEIRQCRACEAELPHAPRPVIQASRHARVLIIGQAPGRRVHQSGIPWNDPSGDRLREWTGLTADQFYDPRLVALAPMGFCFPGAGKSGDLPPLKRCAELWHDPLLERLKSVQLTLLIGAYAQAHYLPGAKGQGVTAAVRRWREFAPSLFPLPHPSGRNNRFFKENPWFTQELLPALRRRVKKLVAEGGKDFG